MSGCGAVAALCVALVTAANSGALAASGDTIFTIANYPVEARAGDAVAAKELAIADGRKAALRSLMKRLVPVSAYGRLKSLAAADAGRLLEGIRVRSERNSTTEYVASLDFTFNAAAIRALLERDGLAFTDEQARAITVVPVWRVAGAVPPGFAQAAGAKAWFDAWKSLDLEHTLTPVKLEALKPEVHADTIKALAAGDGSMLRTFANEYRADTLLVAIAEPDMAGGKLHVVLIGQDAVGAMALKRSYRVDAAEPAYAVELAAVVSLGVLEGRWKATTVRGTARPQGASGGGFGATPTVAGAASGRLQFAVEFRGMGEWAGISRRLVAIPGVEEVDVDGLSQRGARVSLRYREGIDALADTLAQQGLILRPAAGDGASAGGWVLSAN